MSEKLQNQKESEIEKKLVRGVKAAGGLCLKWVSPGCPGVPDRIVITPGGRVVFVELKQAGGRVRPLQRFVIDDLRKRGAEVWVVKGASEADLFLEEVLR